MKVIKLCLILCFISSAVFAQSNYHESYILRNNGDTVKGYINYHEWAHSPKVIDFKNDINDKKVIRFRPDEIKEFDIIGMERFISYTGIISNNKITLPNYPDQLDTTKILDTVFLQQIATGNNLTLYYNCDNTKSRFFIAEKSGQPVELKYYIYYNDEHQVVTAPVYNSQLQQYVIKFQLHDTKLLNKLVRTNFNQTDLTVFVDALNNVDEKNDNINKGKSSRFYVGAGVNITNTRYSQSTGDLNATTVSPKITFGIDLFNNPHVQQFVFRVEASVWYASPRLNSPTIVDDNLITAVNEFNQYSATITPQILFNIYNKDNLKVYIDAGWAFNFSKYTNNQRTIEGADAETTAAYTVQKPYELASSWSSFPLQAGVVINKRLEIYAGYAFYAAYTDYIGFSIANQTTNIGAKLLFK